MPPRFARGNRDKNEPKITEVLRRMNVEYCLLPEGAGADILVYLSPLMLIEVKNPEVSEYDQRLSPRELEIQELCNNFGDPYHVVKYPEEMAKIIGDWIDKVEREARNNG